MVSRQPVSIQGAHKAGGTRMKAERKKKSNNSARRAPKKVTNSFEENLSKILPYYSIALLLTIYSTYIAAAYLRKPIESFILYQAVDPGYTAPPFVNQPILGVHYFSDFLQIMSYATNVNGYSTNLDFPNMYGPVTVFLFKILSNFPYIISIMLITVITVAALTNLMWQQMWQQTWRTKVIFVVFFLLLSRPLMLTIDRGNIQGIVVALNLAALYYFYSEKYNLAKIFLIIAISLKFYPVMLVLIFIRKRMWKDTLQTLTISGILFLISLAIISRSDFIDSIRGIFKGAAVQSGFASSGFSPSGWTIRLLEMLDILNFENGSNQLIRLLQLSITLSILAVGIFLFLKLDLNETQQWIYILVFTSFITPVAWGYNLIWLPFVIQRMLTANDWRVTSARKIMNTYQKYLPLLLSLLLIPYPWIFRGGNRINVGVQELTIFPIFIILLYIWLKNNLENRVQTNEK